MLGGLHKVFVGCLCWFCCGARWPLYGVLPVTDGLAVLLSVIRSVG